MDRFGCEILKRLEETERSQAWLARKVGHSPSMLSLWIRGKRPWRGDVRLAVEILLDIRNKPQEEEAA